MRKSWPEYFMDIAHQAATRSTCSRKHVGCIIVKDKTIVSTGYNGSIKGYRHCDHTENNDLYNVNGETHCDLTTHAEMNAIAQAAKNGVSIEGASIYVTASPCWLCFKVIANAGIKHIIYSEFYRDDRFIEIANRIGISIRQVK